MARFALATAGRALAFDREIVFRGAKVLLDGTPRAHAACVYIMMDEKSVPTRQLDRNGDATRRVGREKRCDPKLCRESCRQAFPSIASDAFHSPQ